MTIDYQSLKDFLPPCDFEFLSKDQTKEIERRWLLTFAKHKQGCNLKAYKWHIFSNEAYLCVEAEAARTLYLKQVGADFIILPNDIHLENAVKVDILPDLTGYFDDYYIMPQNMAWTMAFTHEEGWYGPYFAKHPHYHQLVEDNERLLKKKQEIAHAKVKGWIS